MVSTHTSFVPTGLCRLCQHVALRGCSHFMPHFKNARWNVQKLYSSAEPICKFLSQLGYRMKSTRFLVWLNKMLGFSLIQWPHARGRASGYQQRGGESLQSQRATLTAAFPNRGIFFRGVNCNGGVGWEVHPSSTVSSCSSRFPPHSRMPLYNLELSAKSRPKTRREVPLPVW